MAVERERKPMSVDEDEVDFIVQRASSRQAAIITISVDSQVFLLAQTDYTLQTSDTPEVISKISNILIISSLSNNRTFFTNGI